MYIFHSFPNGTFWLSRCSCVFNSHVVSGSSRSPRFLRNVYILLTPDRPSLSILCNLSVFLVFIDPSKSLSIMIADFVPDLNSASLPDRNSASLRDRNSAPDSDSVSDVDPGSVSSRSSLSWLSVFFLKNSKFGSYVSNFSPKILH